MHGSRRKPFFRRNCNLLFIRSLSLCVIFSLSGLYVVSSLRYFIASAMKSLQILRKIVNKCVRRKELLMVVMAMSL